MQPLPNIAYEGDPDICHGFLPKARQLLGVVLGQMGYNKLGVYRGHLRLSDTAYCYAVVAGGVSSIRIVADGSGETSQAPISQHWKTPDFLSGVVLGGQLTTTATGVGLCHSFLPTPDCGRLFGLNAKGQPPTIQDSAKLAVEGFAGIADNDPTIVTRYVQSGLIRPTQWTGTMRLCIQALMGFGKPGKKSIYARSAFMPAETKKPAKTGWYEQQVANKGRQIRYDYRFFRTHGLVKAADGVWWLVEIGMTRGVVAMPLPLYEDTQPGNTSKSAQLFRAKLAKLNDTAAQKVIETFGGFPTGESFPTDGDAFEAWVRAGKILKLLAASDMQYFYDYQAYSSVLGWAFSDSGHEAHNTAWGYADNGVIWGIHDSIAFSFGATVAALRSESAVKAIRQALQGQEKDNPKTYLANLYKLRRLSNIDFDSVTEEYNRWGAAAAYTLLNNLSGVKLSVATAKRTRVGIGKLWDNQKPKNQVQLKFPEPLFYKCLLSFDFNPLVANPQASAPQECDTTVHVFFIGEELHWVKYFYSGKNVPTRSHDDFEDCMLSGSWSGESTTNAAVPKMLYTNLMDDRREVGETLSQTTITGEDLGYTRVAYGDWIPEVWMSTLSRTKTFLVTTKTVNSSGPALKSTVLVPFMDRASYYYAVTDGYGSVTRSESQTYKEQKDPWTATGNRAFGGYQSDQIPECGNPDARRCKSVEYNPGGCSDVADEGQWVNKCDSFDDMAYNVPLPDLPGYSSSTAEDATLLVKFVSGFQSGNPVIVRFADINSYGGLEHWFLPSPDPDSDWRAWLWATHNALGETEIMEYADTPDGNSVKIKGELGFYELEASQLFTFVGCV